MNNLGKLNKLFSSHCPLDFVVKLDGQITKVLHGCTPNYIDQILKRGVDGHSVLYKLTPFKLLNKWF